MSVSSIGGLTVATFAATVPRASFNLQRLFLRLFEMTSKNTRQNKGKMAIVRHIFDFRALLTSEGFLLKITLKDP